MEVHAQQHTQAQFATVRTLTHEGGDDLRDGKTLPHFTDGIAHQLTWVTTPVHRLVMLPDGSQRVVVVAVVPFKQRFAELGVPVQLLAQGLIQRMAGIHQPFVQMDHR